jgi:hypothetical protein
LNQLEAERLFSYAVALDQSGRQKNSIFAWGNVVYVVNSDKTILLRFESSQDISKEPIGFFANDYDSPNFVVEGKEIIFIQKDGVNVRNKRCKIPNQGFGEVEELFFKFYSPEKFPFHFSFHKSSLNLIDPDLSHIELTLQNKELSIVQRDIYSGTIISIQKKPKSDGLGIQEEDSLPGSLVPLGMRTNDFLALFSFNDMMKIHFSDQLLGYFVVEGIHNNMLGVVAGCLYDDLGTIHEMEVPKDGGKEPESGVSQQAVNRKVDGQVLRKRIR